MKKNILFLLVLIVIVFKAQAGDEKNHVCRNVWKVSKVEVEGYVYSDSSMTGIQVQFFINGKCIVKTIEYDGMNSNTPVKVNYEKGKVVKEKIDWSLDLFNHKIIINPNAPVEEQWVWNIIETSYNKIVFTTNEQIDGENYLYKYTLEPVKNCRTLED